jgi:hypothetical protein
MELELTQLRARQQKLNFENVIQIKEVLEKTSEGFFGQVKKVFVIIDYPFISFQKEISNRVTKKISFPKEEIVAFITSTVQGYAGIERAGLPTDKVRLSNIFIGIKNK